MTSVQEVFCQCLIFVVFGQFLRLVFLNTKEKRAYIALLTKLLIQFILPALVFRTVSGMRSITKDGWILMADSLIFSFLSFLIAFPIFRKQDLNIRPSLFAGSMGLNIGVFFYPMIENIAGSQGVARLALLDLLNVLLVFSAYPNLYRWARNKIKQQKEEEQQSQPMTVISEQITEEDKEKPPFTDFMIIEVERTITSENDEVNYYTESKWMLLLKKVWLKSKPFLTVFTSLPLDATLLGIVVGVLGHATLPSFIDTILLKMAQCNMFVGMVLLGLLLNLELKVLKKYALYVLGIIFIRFCVATILALVNYYLIGPYFDSLTRLIFAIGFFMPTPVVCGTYAYEFGFDPTLPSLFANVGMIFNFFVTWGILSFVPIPESNLFTK